MTARAAATSAVVVMFLRAMIWLARASDTPTTKRSDPSTRLSTRYEPRLPSFSVRGGGVGPRLRFDGADHVGRRGSRFGFGKNRRADHDAVAQHGDDVARRLIGELQHRLCDRLRRATMFAVAVFAVRVAQCVKGLGDVGVAHRGDVAAQAQHGDDADRHQHHADDGQYAQ